MVKGRTERGSRCDDTAAQLPESSRGMALYFSSGGRGKRKTRKRSQQFWEKVSFVGERRHGRRKALPFTFQKAAKNLISTFFVYKVLLMLSFSESSNI